MLNVSFIGKEFSGSLNNKVCYFSLTKMIFQESRKNMISHVQAIG